MAASLYNCMILIFFEVNSHAFDRPDGVKFIVPTKHFNTHTKCKKGDIVTFSYDSYAQNSAPVNARVHRIREDITWQFILHEHFKNIAKPQEFNGTIFWVSDHSYLIIIQNRQEKWWGLVVGL